MRGKKLKGEEKSVRYNGSVPDGWHSLIENNLVALIGRDYETRDQRRVLAFFSHHSSSLFRSTAALQQLVQLVQLKNHIRAYRIQRRHFYAVGDYQAPRSMCVFSFLHFFSNALLSSNLINRFCQNLLKQSVPAPVERRRRFCN